MKKLLLSLFIIVSISSRIFSQASVDTSAYLLTVGPGTETYSMYGHSALRIMIPTKNIDIIFNWGMFDPGTEFFAWKFAKGRLNYMLATELPKDFINSYQFENRYVYSQKVNLNSKEIQTLMELVIENMKPENATYRYDFFYDDCSTRIRDLFEKSIGDKLKYPEEVNTKKSSTFRNLVGNYQSPYPWLQFGVDLIMGSSSDKKAGMRDQMFLPIEMMEGLSKTFIQRDFKMIPLLQNPVTLVAAETAIPKKNLLLSPVFVFTALLILILILGVQIKKQSIIRYIDIFIFAVFSILSVLMIFFNFFTDHEQMRMNLNIIWLNPLIIVCLLMLILDKPGVLFFRLVFYISAFFLVIQIILPQQFELATLILDVIILVRSSVRSEFNWNPLDR
jgi:hypothetical protein